MNQAQTASGPILKTCDLIFGSNINLSKVIKNQKDINKSSTVIWAEDFGNGFIHMELVGVWIVYPIMLGIKMLMMWEVVLVVLLGIVMR